MFVPPRPPLRMPIPLVHALTLAAPTAPPAPTSWWMNLYDAFVSGSPSGSTQANARLSTFPEASPSFVSMREPVHDFVDVSVECERMGPPATAPLLPLLRTTRSYPPPQPHSRGVTPCAHGTRRRSASKVGGGARLPGADRL